MLTDRKRVQFEFGSASDVGRGRKGELNQDTLGIILPDHHERWHPPLLMVADGLGGYRGGLTASQLVIRIFKQEFRRATHPTNYSALLRLCSQEAHIAIRSDAGRDPTLADMGTTIVAVVLEGDHIHMLNIGDSRAYVSRGNKILQISQDQSWVAAQVRVGIITPQEAIHHPKRNLLEMAITARRREVRPYLSEMALEKNDVIILCSDGLWGVVPESLIWAAASELAPQVAADKLVAMANQSSGPDNISVIVARRMDAARSIQDVELQDTNP